MDLDELRLERKAENNLQKFLKKLKDFNFEEFLYKYRIPLSLLLIGAVLIGFGVFFAKKDGDLSSTKIEVLETHTEAQGGVSEIVVEVSGAVEGPSVYKFPAGSRVEDALIAAGGVSADADRDWMEKFLNRAARLSDGQKIYIPRDGESFGSAQDKQSLGASAKNEGVYQSVSSPQGSGYEDLININTASQSELETLWGIGPVYAKNIIEHRPYSTVEELLSRKIIKSNVYERNKDLLTVY